MYRPVILNIDGITVNVQKVKSIRVFLEITKNKKDNPDRQESKSYRISSSSSDKEYILNDYINEDESLAFSSACLYLSIDNENIKVCTIYEDQKKLAQLLMSAVGLVEYIEKQIGVDKYSINRPG